MSSKADMIIFVGGISPDLEGEEMDVKVEGFSGGDRTDLELPAGQKKLMLDLVKTGKPLVFVMTNGSALAVNFASENVPAIIECWYPGEEGGNAVADVLFGKYNPAGRLPVTFYKSVNDLPAFDDYSMEGRTYRYFDSIPLFPFGFGLSYSTFDYQDVSLSKSTAGEKDTIAVKVNIRNSSHYTGDEVVQIYIRQPDGIEGQPIKALKAFNRVNIPAGQLKTVELLLLVSQLRHFEPKEGDYVVSKGKYELQIGASSADIRLKQSLEVK